MKKVIAILVIVLGFAFNTSAQEVNTVSLEQTKGEFTQKQITLSEGTYIFEIANNNVCGPALGPSGVEPLDASGRPPGQHRLRP